MEKRRNLPKSHVENKDLNSLINFCSERLRKRTKIGSALEQHNASIYREYSELNPQAYDGSREHKDLLSLLVSNSKNCHASFLAIKKLAGEWNDSKREMPEALFLWKQKFSAGEIIIPKSDNRLTDQMRKIVIYYMAKDLKNFGLHIHYRNPDNKWSASAIIAEASCRAGKGVIITASNVRDYYYED